MVDNPAASSVRASTGAFSVQSGQLGVKNTQSTASAFNRSATWGA